MSTPSKAESQKRLFETLLQGVDEVASRTKLERSKAFPRWFAELYYLAPYDFFPSDGSSDGKVDLIFKSNQGGEVVYHLINSKFTATSLKLAPKAFYDEVRQFRRPFEEPDYRDEFLSRVQPTLRSRYESLLEAATQGRTRLLFLTNHRLKPEYAAAAAGSCTMIGAEELLRFVSDDIDLLMPHTPDLVLNGIQQMLWDKGSAVHIAVVFARLLDFKPHMRPEMHDLLFAANVRVHRGNTDINRAIADTCRLHPSEVAYSNNGITLTVDGVHVGPKTHTIRLVNPRVVNGSQTLHAANGVQNLANEARVLTRIVNLGPLSHQEVGAASLARRQVAERVSIRSNSQNQIKTWDLVANDEYQIEVYRFFRKHQVHFDRRQGEWKTKARELAGLGLRLGPSLKLMAQLSAAAYYDQENLGPANARSNAAELFEGKNYDQIRRIKPAVAFQLFELDEAVRSAWSSVGAATKGLRELKTYPRFLMISLLVRAIDQSDLSWGTEKLTVAIQRSPGVEFNRCVRVMGDYILDGYKMARRATRKAGKGDLTLANYFKSVPMMSSVVRANGQAKFRKPFLRLLEKNKP